MKRLVLASGSPRRSRILQKIGVEFTAVKSSFSEHVYSGDCRFDEYVCKNAIGKARNIEKQYSSAIIIGADTAVECNGRILGKPATMDEAIEYLEMLQGIKHSVYTGLALVDTDSGRSIIANEKTLVDFNRLSRSEICIYLSRVNPLDKAGGYAIQGAGAVIVNNIVGCYYNVVGFPVSRLENMLSGLGVSLFDYIMEQGKP
jgi:septum formation protein